MSVRVLKNFGIITQVEEERSDANVPGRITKTEPGSGKAIFAAQLSEDPNTPGAAKELFAAFCDGKLVDISKLSGPYAHLIGLVIDAAADHQFSAQEGVGIGLEAAHLAGLDQKIGGLFGGLIGKIVK